MRLAGSRNASFTATSASALDTYRCVYGVNTGDPAYAAYEAASYMPHTQPTLYLHGRDDGCMAASLVEGAETFLTGEGSAAHVLDGCGHFLHLERPDEVNSLIVDFLT